MPMINANGCDFYYDQQGHGRDIVFIHGELQGMDYWEYQMSEFSKDYRCLAYSRRGHAKTGWTDYGFSLVNQTRDLEHLIARLGIVQPIIIALAFGTAIAANYAIQNPKKVKGMVMMAWSEMHDSLQYFERWVGYNQRAAEALERDGRDGLIDLLRREGGKSIYKVISTTSPIREKIVRLFASHPLGEYQRGSLELGLSVQDLVPAFRELDIPVLGICGAEDPYPNEPERLKGMKSFREEEPIAGGSRFAHWEYPAEFNRVIRKFLSSLD
jgi:pimeloyl-ACP methyl ester carboxylesterase